VKQRCSNQRNQAMTLTEVLVVVAMLSLLAAVALAQAANSEADSKRKACVKNLMQIGLACRIWAGDNGGKFPMQVPARLGGAKEAAARGNVAQIFLVMSNELLTPILLVCPADTNRFSATYFTRGFDNGKVSYFAGLDAGEGQHSMFLSGDENFAIGGTPIKPGLLLLATNAPISWTAARHMNQGNIGFADGSVAVTSSSFLRQKLVQTGIATNRLAIP
jgi:prepilin-type N-terminal cleavage/methylation domain-containing protein/prepilin-type processing-associated H-X9-DG protein